MTKSIYRKAAEHIANGDTWVSVMGVGVGGRIYSCVVIDALMGYDGFCDRSPERVLYEDFMCYNPESDYPYYRFGIFDTDEQAILALLLFDEILKHKDND